MSTTELGGAAGAGPRLRLFVALEMPEAVREALSGWGRLAAGGGGGAAGKVRGAGGEVRGAAGEFGGAVRPVPAGSLHVTLCFLGDTAAERVAAIADACEVARGCHVGELRVGGGLWLPRRRPRVLAVELEDPDGRLAALQGELTRALTAIRAFQPDPRPFLAHTTVARVRGGARFRPAGLSAPPPMAFAADRVVLYRTVLGDGPARYDALHGVQLSRR